jgi:hypothetical protein
MDTPQSDEELNSAKDAITGLKEALVGRFVSDDELDEALKGCYFFSLDTERFRQFTALLDAPAAPSAGLERLMDVQAPWAPTPLKEKAPPERGSNQGE